MLDLSYNPSSLRKHLRRSDFEQHRKLRDKDFLRETLQLAALRANASQPIEFLIAQSKKRGKAIYSLPNITDTLLLRKAAVEVRQFNPSMTFSRQLLVSSLKSLLQEAPPFNIFRFDIASFYESFKSEILLEELQSTLTDSPTTYRIIGSLLSSCNETGCSGLPRGIGVSQSISDLMLSPLDEYFKYRNDVYFYGRYVDDIVLLAEPTLHRRKAIQLVLQQLPEGMHLNQTSTKKKTIAVPRSSKSANLPLHQRCAAFSYLGYSFNICNVGRDQARREKKNEFRSVTLDIAESKVKKIKTKLVRAILDFLQTQDYCLLEARIKLLTSNYSLPEKVKRSKRLAGIFYNYSLVDGDTSSTLHDLDAFLKVAVLSKSGRIFYDFNSKLSPGQRLRILKNSFLQGFTSKRIIHFSPRRVREIGRCWQDI